MKIGSHNYRYVQRQARMRIECNCGWNSHWYSTRHANPSDLLYAAHKNHVEIERREERYRIGEHIATAIGVLVSAAATVAIVWFIYARPI